MESALFFRKVVIGFAVSFSSIFCFAQFRSGGSISGAVTTAGGAAMVSATVTLSGLGGFLRTSAVSADGLYLLQDLPSGNYTLKATAAGFASYQAEQVSVAIGRTTRLDFPMKLASVEESVTVTSTQSTIDPSQSSSVVNIDRDRIEELPIPSRNYLSFVLLSPQVMAANPAVLQQGLMQSGGGFSFGGLRPGSNAIYLDEGNDNDEYSGSSRTQLSPETISDFQIVNHGFAAQSGGGSGGSINVQTRGGANAIHGDAFAFVQNGLLNGTPPLGRYPAKPDESRVRVGTSIGGPIVRDRTYYFVGAEQESAKGEDTNDLSPATLATINGALRQYAPLTALTLQSGFFPTSDQETEITGRVDHAITPRESLLLRYAFTNSRSANDAFHTDELTDRTARGSAFVQDHSVNGTLTSTLSANLLHKFSFEVAQRRVVERTGSSSMPGILVPGVVQFGTPYSGNGRRYETHVEFAESVSLQRRQHLFGAGVRVDHVALRTKVMDGAAGVFVFADLTALQAGNADFFTQTFGDQRTNFAEVRTAAFAQDHWIPIRSVTVDYGLRYEYNRLPQVSLGGLPQDRVNFSPRFGVAWTPAKSTVVRGGFGIFYDRYLLSTITRLATLDGAHAFRQIEEDTSAAAVYRSGGAIVAALPGVAPSIARADAGLRNPSSEVASFGVERALLLQTTLSLEYQFVRGLRLGRTSNVNLATPVVLRAGNAAALGVSGPTAQQIGRPVFSSQRINSAFDAVDQFATTGASGYHGATVTLNRQFQEDVQLLVGYTFSKTTDTASYDGEQPQNPYALQGERALSLQDQRHRFTLSGLWVLGPDRDDANDARRNAEGGLLTKLVTGVTLAPIVSIASGFRASAATGLDSNRAHIYPFAARPAGYGRNTLSTSAQVNVDFRLVKTVPLGRGHLDVVGESFNLLNHRNVSLIDAVNGSGAMARAGFGKAIATTSARRVQFSLDYEF